MSILNPATGTVKNIITTHHRPMASGQRRNDAWHLMSFVSTITHRPFKNIIHVLKDMRL